MDDYARGYRGHLPHPCTVLQGTTSCMLCGGHPDRKMHDEPHQRITEAQYRAEQHGLNAEDARMRGQPQPPWPWDNHPPDGQGDAGGYVAHLREKGYHAGVGDETQGKTVMGLRAPDGDAARRAWKDLMFLHHYGGKPAIKEASMKHTITLELTSESLDALAEAALDLAEYDNVSVRVYQRPQVVAEEVTEAVESDYEPLPTRVR